MSSQQPSEETPDVETEGGDDCPDYQAIKAMAVALNRPAATLIALSDTCDPFYVTPARRAAAQWFAEVWRALDPPAGVHLRRLHYAIVSLPENQRPPKLDGTPYQNTEGDWRLLNAASVDARALGLVDAARFTDRRAGEPLHLAGEEDEDREAVVFLTGGSIEPPPAEAVAFGFYYAPRTYAMPGASPSVYASPPVLAERCAVEVWAEKSTMNDVLMPLARSRNFTLVTGVGDLSLNSLPLVSGARPRPPQAGQAPLHFRFRPERRPDAGRRRVKSSICCGATAMTSTSGWSRWF